MLKVNEIYKSIQGESGFVGYPCTFVRLTGCHLRCVWCDTAYAFYEGREMSVEKVVEEIKTFGIPLVELTGGEPLLQEDAFELIRRLLNLNYQVLIETSGAVSLKNLDTRAVKIMDVKCPGSHMTEHMIWENFDYLKDRDEVKFVIKDRHDFDWACDIIQKRELQNKVHLLFSPVFGELEPQRLAEWILGKNIQVRMQLQIHKYIWNPEMRGV